MEISCAKCSKHFKLRTSMEKHQYKCQNVQSLKKRISQLELQLQESYGKPTITFQEYIDKIYVCVDDITEEKAEVIYSNVFKRWIKNGECIKLDGKMVFDETRGWILIKNVSAKDLEKIARIIQSKLLGALSKNEDYYKNVIKLTKKWSNIYKYL
uniref:Uncharacterized protein n=1 Tax=viral metagenome TaxID=1070528 RepID=A0A6C0HU32_9ZZZZ